ncbi:MAG: hypothetical protein ACE5KA_03065 [Nitrososphaerales archaeon]
MVWLMHGVDKWHLDCDPTGGKHNCIASVMRANVKFELEIWSDEGKTLRKDFNSVANLNEYLRTVGLEELQI